MKKIINKAKRVVFTRLSEPDLSSRPSPSLKPSTSLQPETLSPAGARVKRERDGDGDDNVTGQLGGGGSIAWRQSNSDLASSILSCKEEKGEWRHNGSWPCMPLVVAGRTYDERRELCLTRPSSRSSGRGREEEDSNSGIAEPETLALTRPICSN